MTQKLLPSLLRVALWVSGSGMATNLGVRPPKKAIILDKTAPIHSWGLRSTFLLPGGRIVIRAQEALACAHSPWTMRVMNWGWAQRAARARLPLYLLEDLSPPRAVWAISDAIQMRHSNSDGHKHSPQAFAKPIHSVFSRVFHDETIARHKRFVFLWWDHSVCITSPRPIQTQQDSATCDILNIQRHRSRKDNGGVCAGGKGKKNLLLQYKG